MGKVIVWINTTPDGFCDSKFVIADAEYHEFVHSILSNTQTVAFGRNSFEMFQGVWPPILEKDNQPQSQVKMAQALNDIDKTVFSATLRDTKWNNSTIVKNIDPDAINNFKRNNDKNLLTIGSPGIVAALTKLDLVDEYYFSIHPNLGGSGTARLFDNIKLDAKQPLKFAGTKVLQSGVVIIHYLKGAL